MRRACEPAASSVVDVAGQAAATCMREFVPGTGGSHDLLAMPGVFAILPARRAAMAPGAAVGERIWLLRGRPGPGGRLVCRAARELASGAAGRLRGHARWRRGLGRRTRTVAVADGSMVVPGYRGDGLQDRRARGRLHRPGACCGRGRCAATANTTRRWPASSSRPMPSPAHAVPAHRHRHRDPAAAGGCRLAGAGMRHRLAQARRPAST